MKNKIFFKAINITEFGNCPEVLEFDVNLLAVQYNYVNNMCDTVNGQYIVHRGKTVYEYEVRSDFLSHNVKYKYIFFIAMDNNVSM